MLADQVADDAPVEGDATAGVGVLFGNAAGGRPAPLPSIGRLIGGNVALAGFSMSRLTATSPERAAAALRQVLGLLHDRRLDLTLTEIASLDSVPAAHQLLAEGRGTGKYVASLTPRS